MKGLLVKKIKENKNFFFSLISGLAVVIWYLNFSFLKSFLFLNIFCFIIYFILNSLWLGKILKKRGFEKETQFIFGGFSLVYLIAFGMAIPIVVYNVRPFYLFIWLLLLTLIISFWAKKIKQDLPEKKLFEEIEKKQEGGGVKKIVYFIFWALFFIGWLLLFYSRTGEFIRSPWEVIHPLYLYAWLGIIFIMGWLAFSRIRFKNFLFLIILISFLCHAYLIIPYQAGFGGDKWRHLGAEKWLMQGNVYAPTLIGEKAALTNVGPLKVPEVLVAGNKTSYANMWGLVIALSWLTGIDVFYLDLLIGFLLFSIFLPFLLLKLGLFFSRKKEFLALLLLIPFCFYPFQAYASITVPMTFSFLPFLFSLIFIGRYLTEKKFSLKIFYSLIFLIPFLYFNYLIYLILFLEIFVLAIIFKNFYLKKKLFLPLIVFCTVVMVIFIPALETYNQYSWLKNDPPPKSNFIEMVNDFPVKLFFSQAVFPRIYGLEQDNWLYATTDKGLSRSVIFELLPWVFILTPLVWLLFFYGLKQIKKLKHPEWGKLFVIVFLIVFLNQAISFYFLDGNHLLSKRLVVFTSFLFFFPLSAGIYFFVKNLENVFSQKALIFCTASFLALLSVTVYVSGPKFQVVTGDEFKAAKYLWEKIEKNVGQNYCVLANTWPLLSLEGVSGRQIIAGGFPYYYEYRQPERVQLFDNLNKNPSLRDLNKALEITKSKECYFMTEERWLYFDKRKENIEQLDKILGPRKEIGKVMIWHYQPD